MSYQERSTAEKIRSRSKNLRRSSTEKFALMPLTRPQMMDIDYYETLEINRNATDADIKQAYRRLALKWHPSKNYEKFTLLGEAYDALSEPRKKTTYDRFGKEGLRKGIPPEFDNSGVWSSEYVYHGNPDKTSREFFGCDNPFAAFHVKDSPLHFDVMQPGLVKKQDPPIERDIYLSLDDLFHGCTKKIKFCRRVMNEDGRTSTIKDKTLTLNVNPGWKEGTRITYPKEGDQGPNSIPADIIFIVRQKNHPLFVRQLDDLIYKAQISLEMALTGFSVKVETLDGRLLTIPINFIVNPACKKVVAKEGMPLSHDPSQRGDLIITFDIQFPEKLSAERKHLIKQALTFK